MCVSRNVYGVVLCALVLTLGCKSKMESKFGAASNETQSEVSFDDYKAAEAPMEAPEELAKESLSEKAELADEEEIAAPSKKLEMESDKSKNSARGGEGKGGKKDEETKKKKPKSTWKKSVVVANASKLMIGESEELPIQGMQVFAKVDGFRARVLIDFYFHNPDSTQYEGTFKLRLPEGASPYFLAFGQSKVEVDSKLGKPKPDLLYDDDKAARGRRYEPREIMVERAASWVEPREARMVPKKQAARAYKDTVRRRVDPALMEWGGAGVFNARIFPIQPNKVHRVVVGYDMNIEQLDGDLLWSLPLPQGLPSSSVNLEIARLPGTDITISTARKTPLEDGDKIYYQVRNPTADSIDVRIKGAPQVALQSDEAGLGATFAARVQPTLPVIKEAKSGNKDALLLIDKSLSANPEKFNIWLTMAEKLLTKNRDTISRFNVIFFDVEARVWREDFVENTAQNVSAMLDEANTMSLEGATDLGAVLQRASNMLGQSERVEGRADLFLLSDGAITWGQGDAFLLTEQLKRQERVGSIFAYRTGLAGTDTRMLSHLTRETGGAMFSVVGESEIAAAAMAHRNRPFKLKRVTLEGATDVVLAGRPQVIYPGQRLLMAGRGVIKPGSKVTFLLERGAETHEVTTTLEHVVSSPLASRTYGQIAVNQLEELLGSTRPFAEAYARHFRVTGKSTSLLMLESEADYERFGIVPKDDISAIKGRLVTDEMLGAFDAMAMRLGDARAALLYLIEELGTMPGVEAKIPAELVGVLKSLPGEAFVMQSGALECKMPQKKGISSGLLRSLAKRDVTYDVLTKEAERRRKAGTKGDALRTMSSLVEQSPGDSVLALDVGYSAMNWGLPGHAYFLFERVAESRPFEPQAWRALANAAVDQKKPALAAAYFEIGLAGSWDPRFGEFKRILAQDYLRFIHTQGSSAPGELKGYLSSRRARLMDIFGVKSADMVITITWNTDNTDVDLHVMEPSGEECYYGHRETASGGQLTQDVTQGYGPEMYVLQKAPKGKYTVRAKYFSSDRNRKSARTKVHATIIRNWGKKNESIEQRIVTLEDNKDMHDLITIKAK